MDIANRKLGARPAHRSATHLMRNNNQIGIAAAILLFAGASAFAAEAPDTWAKNCASCHGTDGGGHTKAGKKKGAKDLTDAAYQKTFTDDHAFKAVKEGLKDDSGADKMNPFADKLTDDEIKTLVTYVRTLAK
jgi:mono/diheme cytochrome c family protein